MKTIKIDYANVSADFNKEQNLIYDLLKLQGYDVQITPPDADYLICEVDAEDPYQFCGKPQVRIQYSGENFIPDFNLIDYAICPYPISFGDRNFHLPVCVWPRSHWQALAGKDRNYTLDFVRGKEYFANFITSHESEYNLRGDFFQALNRYKRVESPGSYLNNMPGGATVDWMTEDKTEFQRKCKFTLCFESTLHQGFVTEKLMDAFYADTIPVYYGSSAAAEIFNKDAFLNVAEFASFDDAIARIRELDEDEEAYLAMLRQPILVDPEYPRKLEAALGAYIRHIFDQPIEKAYRRSRVYSPKSCDDYLARAVDSETLTMKNLLHRIAVKLTDKLGK